MHNKEGKEENYIKRKLSFLSFKKDQAHDPQPHPQLNQTSIQSSPHQEIPKSSKNIELTSLHSPEYRTNSRSNSNSSSLIFERSVQPSIFSDSSTPYNSPPSNDYFSMSPSYYNKKISKLPSHHNSENFIAPVLDLTAEIITDNSTNYDNIDIISCNYPKARSRSIISDSLLSCIDSNNSNSPMGSSRRESRPKHYKEKSMSDLSSIMVNNSMKEREKEKDKENKTVNFYSYNDMLNSESRKNSILTLNSFNPASIVTPSMNVNTKFNRVNYNNNDHTVPNAAVSIDPKSSGKSSDTITNPTVNSNETVSSLNAKPAELKAKSNLDQPIDHDSETEDDFLTVCSMKEYINKFKDELNT